MQVQRDGQWRIGGAIVVQPVGVVIATRWQLGNIGAHQLHRARAQLGHGGQHLRIAVFVQQFVQPARAQGQRIDLSVHVAIQAVGLTGIGSQDIHHIAA